MWSTTVLQLLAIAAAVCQSNTQRNGTVSGATITDSLLHPQPSSSPSLLAIIPTQTATVPEQYSSSFHLPPAPSTANLPLTSTTTATITSDSNNSFSDLPTPSSSTPSDLPVPSSFTTSDLPTPSSSTSNLLAPSSSTSDLLNPSSSTSDLPTPPSSTSNLPAPLSSTSDLPTPSSSTSNLLAPSSSTSDLLNPSSSTSDLPTPPSSTSNLPAPLSSTSDLPTPSSSTSNLLAPSSSTSDLLNPSSSTSDLPTPPSSTSNLPAPLSSTSDLPTPSSSTSNLLAPSSSTSDLLNPSSSTCDLPAPSSSTPDLPRTSTLLIKPTPSGLPSSNTSPPKSTATEGPPTSIIGVLRLNVGVVVGVVAGLVLILVLLCILCCVCCYGFRRSHSKKKLNLTNSGLGYENKTTTELYTSPNIVSGTSYRSHNHSALDVQHYESAINNYSDRERELLFNGESSQVLGSQPLHSQSSVAHGDVFQKNTLPELSPMSYSLTATYPFHPDTNNNQSLYLNSMPASNVSLRQPTMFAISLQNEESKSAQGSRSSMPGSKANSIHSSRPSMYGSRMSGLYGSRPLVVSHTGTSRESLLGVQGVKEHSVEEGKPNMRPSHMFSSPSLLPESSTDNMDAPTRDSPLPCPLTSATSVPLGHGKKDFASLTCILDYGRGGGSISPSSPFPLESAEHLEQKEPSHMHQRLRRDLVSLTSLGVMDARDVASRGKEKGRTILEDEDSYENSKVALEKVKEETSAAKRPRFKAMSRLEKLTSLDYIRQSFRIKKKVSFEPSPEHKPTSLSRSKTGVHKAETPYDKGETPYDMILTNELAHNHPDGIPAGPEGGGGGRPEWKQGRHTSSTSTTEMFSPTENILHSMFLQQQQQQQQQQHPFTEQQYSMGVSHYAAPLSQTNYFLPAHVGAVGPRSPLVYPHPQLSQQYYSPLSQNYPYHAPYHIPIGDTFGRGSFRDGLGDVTMRSDLRYHEVFTPDYSDASTSEHERFAGGGGGGGQGKRIDSEDSSYGGVKGPEFIETTTNSDLPMNHAPNMTDKSDMYSNGFFNSNYFREELDLMQSPRRHCVGYGREGRGGGGGPEHLHEEQGVEGEMGLGRYLYHHPPMDHILEDVYLNSINVDDPSHQNGGSHSMRDTVQNQSNSSMKQRHSKYSETSPRMVEVGEPVSSKGHVSWNTTVTTYPTEQDNSSDQDELTEL